MIAMDTKKLRQKILDLAIRDKLVPQDPNDEPATALLERMRAKTRKNVLLPKAISNARRRPNHLPLIMGRTSSSFVIPKAKLNIKVTIAMAPDF